MTAMVILAMADAGAGVSYPGQGPSGATSHAALIRILARGVTTNIRWAV